VVSDFIPFLFSSFLVGSAVQGASFLRLLWMSVLVPCSLWLQGVEIILSC